MQLNIIIKYTTRHDTSIFRIKKTCCNLIFIDYQCKKYLIIRFFKPLNSYDNFFFIYSQPTNQLELRRFSC